jgi:radical SAM superfamily enzyme YgiQ (UPF0313 family)
MKVALVQAPVWWTLDPPLGLAQIAGCAGAAGHEVQIVDLNIRLWKARTPKYENMWLWEQFHFWNNPRIVREFFRDNSVLIENEVQRILRSDAKVIGFSVYLGAQWATLELARMIKKADPSRIVVCGGQFFFKGDAAAEWIKNPEIDAVVRGNGDFVFPELLKSVAATGAVAPIPGVVCKSRGSVVDRGTAPPIENLDLLPFADIKGFPLELYEDQNRIPFAASRGCVWKCHFCSTTQFWSGYSYMSGERMFAEVRHHKKLFPDKQHLEFYDITANGSVPSLVRFSELTAEARTRENMYFGWKINAIIRPEMTRDVLDKMRKALCQDIIYGIESGSPRVLKLMNKPYRVEVAEQVLRDTHESGITATGNFMFGFPGETEEDFKLTLDFVEKNARSLDRVYASTTFTSLEEHSYLTDHQRDLGVKEVARDRFHNLYWETVDGENNYPVRIDRYRRFRELSISLSIDAYKGVNGNLEQDQLANLAQYEQYRADHLGAVGHFLEYLKHDLFNGPIRGELAAYRPWLRAVANAQRALERMNRLISERPLIRAAVQPYLNDGPVPPEASFAWHFAWHRSARFLDRARRQLLTMPEERRAEIRVRGGALELHWGPNVMPSSARLTELARRVETVLSAVESRPAEPVYSEVLGKS